MVSYLFTSEYYGWMMIELDSKLLRKKNDLTPKLAHGIHNDQKARVLFKYLLIKMLLGSKYYPKIYKLIPN